MVGEFKRNLRVTPASIFQPTLTQPVTAFGGPSLLSMLLDALRHVRLAPSLCPQPSWPSQYHSPSPEVPSFLGTCRPSPWFSCYSFCGSYGGYPTLVLFWFQVCPSHRLGISNPTQRTGVEWRTKQEVRGLGRKSSQEVTILPSFKTTPTTKSLPTPGHSEPEAILTAPLPPLPVLLNICLVHSLFSTTTSTPTPSASHLLAYHNGFLIVSPSLSNPLSTQQQRDHSLPCQEYTCCPRRKGTFQVVLMVKNLPPNARDTRDVGSIPESERSLE